MYNRQHTSIQAKVCKPLRVIYYVGSGPRPTSQLNMTNNIKPLDMATPEERELTNLLELG